MAEMMLPTPSFWQSPHGYRLAYRQSAGEGPGLVWCGGLRSDMEGGKATALHEHAEKLGLGFTRFDYRGHGSSDGDFADGTVSDWLDDTLNVLDTLTEGPQVLVGSSLGGWIALLTALARPERIAGLMLIAPAADFTEKLMWEAFPEPVKREIREKGFWMRPSEYDGDYPITRALIADGREQQILDAPIPVSVPVTILQGQQDDAVPWPHAMRTAECLTGGDVKVVLIKDGDHRLSREQDIHLLTAEMDQLLWRIGRV